MCLNPVELLPRRVEIDVVLHLESGNGEGLKLEKLGMRGELLRQDQLMERNRKSGLGMHPSVGNNRDEIIRRHWVSDRNCKVNDMLVLLRLSIFLAQQEGVVIEDIFTITVLDQDPEAFSGTMNRIIPFKVRGDTELNTQHGSSHGLDLSLDFDSRELGH